jgi:hypothetical protein
MFEAVKLKRIFENECRLGKIKTSKKSAGNACENDYSTGSYPPFENGLQRNTRHTPFNKPRTTPCFFKASIIYWLQQGLKRHVAGSPGEIAS